MLGYNDDSLILLDYESHSVLHLWLHSEVKKKATREENSGKETGLKKLTSAEGEEGSTENCISVSKELLHDSRP